MFFVLHFFKETPEMLIKNCVESSEFHALKLRSTKYFWGKFFFNFTNFLN